MATLEQVIFGAGAENMAQLNMHVQTCCNCGIAFAVPREWDRQRREDQAWFYCPNGHSQKYAGPSEADKLRKQLAQEQHRREQIEAERTRMREERDHNARRIVAAKGRITRLRRRCVAGLCTCCNQNFPDLAAHMQEQHPDAATRED